MPGARRRGIALKRIRRLIGRGIRSFVGRSRGGAKCGRGGNGMREWKKKEGGEWVHECGDACLKVARVNNRKTDS